MTGQPEVPPEVLRARAYLSRVAEPACAPLIAFVDEHGPVEAARRIRTDRVLPDELDRATAARRGTDRSAEDLEIAASRGGRLLVPEDPDWPETALLALTAAGTDVHPDLVAPVALWVRGPAALPALAARSVAVVGSRAATDYGLWVAGDWAAGLADAGAATVSGAALGIDGAAHRGTLAAGGTTVAVLACGIDRPYPAAHTRLLDHVAAGGAVVTEYPPGTVPARYRFLVRNRLVAALATGTLIVEAGVRSGAARTAAVARALGRPLMVVPGPVTSALSVGCHALAREPDVLLVGRVDEVVEAVGRIGELAPVRPAPTRETDGLSSDGVRVHGALAGHAARDHRRLAHDSGVDPSRMTAATAELEAAGLAVREGSGWRRRTG